jgi:predicted permease
MKTLRAILHRLWGFFRPSSREAEMNAELQAHLDGLTERNIARGMSPAEARRTAALAFGGAAQVAERARDERRSVWVEQLGQDLRYAARALGKSPSFTVTAVLTLALGIGVNAALFSVVNMVSLRSLPVKEPDNLVTIAGRDARDRTQMRFTYPEYHAYRDTTRTLEGVLAFTAGRWSFLTDWAARPDPARGGVGTDMVWVHLVSENYFGVLGGPIQLGRGISPDDSRLGAPPVIVLSNMFWETRFDRDPGVIGRTLTFQRPGADAGSSEAVTVIGVAAPEFSGHEAVPPAGWLPYFNHSRRAADYEARAPRVLGLIGRLKPGVTEAQAKADLGLVATRWAAEFPGEEAKLSVLLDRGLRFMNLVRTPESVRFLAMILFGFGLVLVIACTNVANLLLARGVARQAEIGVRLTLGAGRGRIVRQLVTENVLLCVVGAGLGLGLAVVTLQLLQPLIMSRLPTDWALESRHISFLRTTPDLRVLGFTALLTLGATLTAGLLPAWHASGASLIAAVRSEGTAFGRRLSVSRLRKLLVIVQVAVSLTLLSCAGMLAGKLIGQQRADIGYDAQSVFGVTATPSAAIKEQDGAFRRVLETVRALPGVAASGIASPGPLRGQMHTRIRRAGAPAGVPEPPVLASFVSDGFFDTLRIPLLRGRGFRDHELHSTARAVIVSETLARELWPGQEAVGQTLGISEERWSTRERPALPEAFRACEVVGVARDILMETMRDDRRLVYLPVALDGRGGGSLFIRPREVTNGALAGIVQAAKAEGIEMEFDRRLSFWVEYYTLPHHAFAVTSAALGALALGMASVGLYGLMTFSVNQRVREIGIRMALGATGRSVVRLFVRQGMKLVVVGLALGLVGGGLFSLALSRLLYGFIDAFDAVAFATVTGLFAAIALLACWLPSRRAARVDPMVALRAE